MKPRSIRPGQRVLYLGSQGQAIRAHVIERDALLRRTTLRVPLYAGQISPQDPGTVQLTDYEASRRLRLPSSAAEWEGAA